MEDIKNFLSKYKGAIIGVIVAIIILATRLYEVIVGILLILEKYVLKKYIEKTPTAIRYILTMFLVIISFYIFAFDDTTKLIDFGKILFGLSTNVFIDNTFLFIIKNYFLIFLISYILSIGIYKILERNKYYGFISNILYILLFIETIAYLISSSYNPFLYFRF